MIHFITHEDFEVINFPAGEILLRANKNLLSKVTGLDRQLNLLWRIQTGDHFIALAQAKAILDRYSDKINLFLPYVPNGRQDRVTQKDEAHGLKIFANLLNTLKFNNVVTIDCHSYVTHAVIDNLLEVKPDRLIMHIRGKEDYNVVIFPDLNASKKYSSYTGSLRILIADKKRDPSTGKIITNLLLPKGIKRALIVDDICDGGASFLPIAEKCKAAGIPVDMYVTHGIFSKGLELLYTAGIQKIHTTNSYRIKMPGVPNVNTTVHDVKTIFEAGVI